MSDKTNNKKAFTKIPLATLQEVEDLRGIWPDEARNFTPWLADHLDILGEAVGLNLQLIQVEASVGKFFADIVASVEDDNGTQTVVIENQLAQTNHDHLGKIITYASGTNAQIVIWVVEDARSEHCQAIQWLNEHTDDNTSFYLVEVHAWKIGTSDPAPKFEVVERPNDWERTVRNMKSLTPAKEKQLEFWSAFTSPPGSCTTMVGN